MSANHGEDSASLCSFTFADGRRCRSPRAPSSPRRESHSHLCTHHGRKEAQALAGEKAGEDIAYFLSGDYVSAGDLSFALGRLFAAVSQGQVKPKTATTLAYRDQTLVETLHLAQNEFINAYGEDSWCDTIRNNFDQSSERQCPKAKLAPPSAPPPQIAPRLDEDESSSPETESNKPPN